MKSNEANIFVLPRFTDLDSHTLLIARFAVLAAGFLFAPALLSNFLSDPASQAPAVPKTTTPVVRLDSAPVKPNSVADMTVEMVVVDAPLDADETVIPAKAEVLELRSNEYTRHLSVVALNQPTNSERQIISKTIDAFSGRIDQLTLLDSSVEESPTPYFQGVGFPQIRTTKKRGYKQFRRFRSLVSYADPETRSVPIPNVRCMGLSPRAVARRAARFSKSIDALSDRYKIDANLVKAVLTRESCFDNAARSHVGAMGLMQLMPETAAWLKVEDPTDASQNLRAGVKYLASLKKRFGSNELALAAYNAGPGNVERYNGVPPFKETRYYIKSVMSHYRSYSATENFTRSVAIN